MGESRTIDDTRTIATLRPHDLLEDARQGLAVWMRRRQEALDTGLDALTRMSACKTPVEMAVITGEWLAGSMTRVLADLEDGQAQTARMAKQFQEASRTLFEPPHVAPAEIHPPVASGEAAAPPQLREAA